MSHASFSTLDEPVVVRLQLQSSPIKAADELDFIEIIGAKEHNLSIDRLEIPKRQLVVFTGVSGSGKSSLAFDTLYAEGQRRYIETLSSYARQFLGQLKRPDVEHLRGLSPTIAIEQKSASNNPRSTVGTITEVYDYLRVLYARAGEQNCHLCGKPVRAQSSEEIVDEMLSLPEGTKVVLLAPLVTHKKGEFKELFEDLRQRGFLRIEIDGQTHRLDEPPKLNKKLKHTLALVIDRLVLARSERQRIAESVEVALEQGQGELRVEIQREENGAGQKHKPHVMLFSAMRTCCGYSFPELSPQSFSFNSPLGLCGACNGLGSKLDVDPELVIPDVSLSMCEGAIAPWASAMLRGEGWTFRIADAVAKACGVDLDTPWSKLGPKKQHLVLYGLTGQRIAVTWGKEGTETHGTWGMRWEGVIPNLMRRYQQSTSDSVRDAYRKFMSERACEACGGKRLRPESLAVHVAGLSIADLTALTVDQAFQHLSRLDLPGSRQKITEGVQREIASRLGFLRNVGLEYLTLDRSGPTLSGGEAQRIRLASQLGSELSGVMYVLDEPSIGLHPRDGQRLIATLRRLRDLGNTVLVVEHDEETIRASDYVIDFGPGAGHLGGHVIAQGSPDAIAEHPDSLTGAYLGRRLQMNVPGTRRHPRGELKILGATQNNLKSIDVRFPLGVLVAVTGVSGAGKSSLVSGILLPALSRALHQSSEPVGSHRAIEGLKLLDKVIAIDQKPIGKTPRSNPGTYTKAFDHIREIFAELPESRARGYSPGRFSFNVKGGRCEACQGDGEVKVEMHFLADVFVPCDVCAGKRYSAQTLAVRYKGKTISDILDTSIDECVKLFENHVALKRILMTIVEVGLGYIKLGQSAPTMSGGEAQRVKLSRELAKSQTGRTLYVLDEPTTGLHFEDIRKLLSVLHRLVDAGNTVVVIEHNMDVIQCADWIIDLGPEGGDAGGGIVAEGSPEQVAQIPGSYTGQFLKRVLDRNQDGTDSLPSKIEKKSKVNGRKPKRSAKSTIEHRE